MLDVVAISYGDVPPEAEIVIGETPITVKGVQEAEPVQVTEVVAFVPISPPMILRSPLSPSKQVARISFEVGAVTNQRVLSYFQARIPIQ